jgi:hypothetical protein
LPNIFLVFRFSWVLYPFWQRSAICCLTISRMSDMVSFNLPKSSPLQASQFHH